jgi:hypothetical protein
MVAGKMPALRVDSLLEISLWVNAEKKPDIFRNAGLLVA